MKFLTIIQYSFNNLKHRKIRSWLTILGIVIGIAAVVALLTIGEGFNREINRQLSSLGSNIISVVPTTNPTSLFLSSGKLYESDAERIKKIPEVEEVAKVLYGRASVGFKEKNITSLVIAVDPDVFRKVSTIEIEEGRFLQSTDRKMAAVGGVFAEEGFGTKNQIKPGNFITINGEKYNIVAVLKKTGGGFGPNAFLDNGIFVVYEDGRKIFKDNLAEKEVNEIEVLVKEDADTKEVAEKITAELAAAHKVKTDEKDFSVIDPQSLQSSVTSILSLVTLFVGAIAGISLIVGGLSIANNMLTSVYERTKEIGILKAVGAKNSDILKIFVFEAGMVGGIGGLFGVILGYAIGLSTNLFGLPTSINPMIGIFGFLFAFIVGVISGYAPSKMAAKLPPIEALRYE